LQFLGWRWREIGVKMSSLSLDFIFDICNSETSSASFKANLNNFQKYIFSIMGSEDGDDHENYPDGQLKLTLINN